MSFNNPEGDTAIEYDLMEERLSKIRTQINSKLENQKNLAVILSAVEENLEEQKNEKTPVAYFVSFLSLLDESVTEDAVTDINIATSTAYFLDIVFPFTPKALLQSKFGDILVKLAVPLTHQDSGAPLVRSTIGALESLLLAQNHQQWISSGSVSPKRALVGLLELSFDPRPKVRRRAQESVHKILMNPPTSPSPIHVASPLVGDISLKRLVSLIETSKGKKSGQQNKETNSQVIHALQLISSITSANSWPSALIENLCDVLLDISKTSDQYLVSAAFSAFEGLFKSMSNIIDIEKFNKVLTIIIELKPSINDHHLAASWLAVVARALESYSVLSPEVCLQQLPDILPIISLFLGSESKSIYYSAAQCFIAIISQTIPDKYLLEPSSENGISTDVYDLMETLTSFLGAHFEKELLSIKYQHATKEVLGIVTACISKLRSRSNPDLLGALEIIGDWRTNETETFPYNKEAEETIAASISAIGAEVVLNVLPLNLRSSNQTGRAWLLPLLRDNVRFSELNYYRKEILPLTDFFKEKISNSDTKAAFHNKVFQTIIDQIWSILPHFCDLPKDLRIAFDDGFAAALADLMYSDISLRVPICHALKLLVESNLIYSEGALEDDLLMLQELPIEESKRNLEYLSAMAANILSVLFNVFSSTLSESAGFILETIEVYLQIVPKNELEVTFNKVCVLLKESMDSEITDFKSKSQSDKNVVPKMSVKMLDLIVSMAKYIPESSFNALFAIFQTTVSSKDNLLFQKRSYRILTKLAETEKGSNAIQQYISDLVEVFITTSDTTQNSARPSRLAAISLLFDLLPQDNLYFIPAILQEIIMSTKDVNEKSRSYSYEILIKMGHLMLNGGVIDNSKVPGFPSGAEPTQATLNEYFTMVSAGLAAQSPHMISATITALSCLVYEFKDELPHETLLEIASTVELFLTHNAREIAKSAIGFVKVEILSLPDDIIKPNLGNMLEKLMRWSHEHKGHFKSKVKHILERLIRKFGIEDIHEAMPEEDKKLITSIKKAKNRAKNKQTNTQENKEGDKNFVSAYEEALYDSDDSDDNQDNYESETKGPAKQFILDTGDEPLDLMDRQSLAHISSSKPKTISKSEASNRKSEFKTKNGKLVFNDDNLDDDILTKNGSGIDAYLDAVKQAPIRGQRNKLKFKKSGNNYESDDFEEEDSLVPEKKPSRSRNINKSKISKPKHKFKSRKKF
ncbi:uncharacterized protein PRCAT00001779001 [Priceomyces carsonii]|uniref:uncharacterized protein n=1 Tax=Priceomyces carsonii TaxID=28549 RepID=UPI002ED86A82|nr:unnamed protein product [Priceomyces carsonii]